MKLIFGSLDPKVSSHIFLQFIGKSFTEIFGSLNQKIFSKVVLQFCGKYLNENIWLKRFSPKYIFAIWRQQYLPLCPVQAPAALVIAMMRMKVNKKIVMKMKVNEKDEFERGLNIEALTVDLLFICGYLSLQCTS